MCIWAEASPNAGASRLWERESCSGTHAGTLMGFVRGQAYFDWQVAVESCKRAPKRKLGQLQDKVGCFHYAMNDSIGPVWSILKPTSGLP